MTPELSPKSRFGDLRKGQIIEEASVTLVEKKHGVYFKLDKKIKGFASVSSQQKFVYVF